MSRQRRRFITVLLLCLASGLTLLAAADLGLLTTWQAQGSDFLFKARSGESSARVGIVGIDDRSIRELAGDGRVFTWPRSHYARVVAALTEAGARVVVLDVLFDTQTAEDEALAGAIGKGNVVLAVAGELPAPGAAGGLMSYDALASSLPVLTRAASAVAHANVHPDGDGTVRRLQLAIAGRDRQEVPSLALTAAARYLRRPTTLEGAPRDGVLPFAGRAIPLADSYRGMLINYLGAPYQEGRASPFPVISFVDVLRGRTDLTPLKDRVVLVGLMATGFADDYWTPTSIGRKMPGVEIHAHAVETLLRADFLRPAGRAATIAVVLIFAFAAGLATYRTRIVPAAGIAAALFVAYLLTSFVLFDRGVLVNMVFPPLAPPLSFGLVAIYRVLFIEADQRAARRLLAGYLSPSVMHEVLKDPERLRLGGEKRTMTVLFSDIRGFTTFSEQMEPEALVHLLNEYLTEMTTVVFEQEGVVDKYMGDGMMTFWGAPVAQEDHARRACLAALDMMRRLQMLHARWRARGIPALSIGVGVHTGPMSVGNMGSHERFSYTVIGDAVNLASRMEGLNKLYGTNLIVSDATLQAAGDGLESRFLDLVAVKGKREPVAVYELLPPLPDEDAAARSARAELLRLYDEGLSLSAERRWQEAGATFQRILVEWPDDGPAAFHLHRCAELAESPPPSDWDGVYVAKTK